VKNIFELFSYKIPLLNGLCEDFDKKVALQKSPRVIVIQMRFSPFDFFLSFGCESKIECCHASSRACYFIDWPNERDWPNE